MSNERLCGVPGRGRLEISSFRYGGKIMIDKAALVGPFIAWPSFSAAFAVRTASPVVEVLSFL